MRIDAHTHSHVGSGRMKLEDLVETVETAKKFKIDKLCVSNPFIDNPGEGFRGGFPNPEQFRQANENVVNAMKKYPKIIIGYCYVNPCYPKEGLDEFKRCVQEYGMKGLKLEVGCRCSNPQVYPLIEKAIEFKVPILQHCWHKATGNYIGESDPLDVAELAKRYKEATIQMAHTGGDWEYGIKAVRDCPNVFPDTSGGEPVIGMVEMAVKELGAERVIFGSDAPGRSFSTQLAKVLGADIRKEEKDLIMGGNIARILKLE